MRAAADRVLAFVWQKGHKLGDNFYVRSDGTRAYYFSVEDLRAVFVESAGFREVELEYIRREYANRGLRQARIRNWIHARFEKPPVEEAKLHGEGVRESDQQHHEG
jgi:methyltransferase-like protein 6